MNNSKEDKKNTLKQLQTLRNSRSRREPSHISYTPFANILVELRFLAVKERKTIEIIDAAGADLNAKLDDLKLRT
jgi:hypothetical protein